MSKPSDYYVGALDLFAVLLPGAIATALVKPRIGDRILGSLFAVPAGELAGWVVFLASSYFLGHLVFFIGSYVDPIFHKWRKRYRIPTPNSLITSAMVIRDLFLTQEERTTINTYQWARSLLIAKFDSAAADIHRVEADSKFFRSLIVLSVIVSLVLLAENQILEGIVAVILAGACTLRYGERRLKSERQAYMHIIVFYRLGLLCALEASANPDRDNRL